MTDNAASGAAKPVDAAMRHVGGGWIALCHAAALPRPGDARPYDPWGVPLLAVRDHEGRIGVFRNVCSHRGRRLVARASHLPGMKIRCPAHQWLYAFDGSLLSAPRYGPARKSGADGVDWKEYGLKPVPATVWLGLVFVNLGPADAGFDTTDIARDVPLADAAEHALTAASAGSIERLVRADITSMLAAFQARLHQPEGIGGGFGVRQTLLGPNALLGRAPGLIYGAVIEPRPRVGCVLHVRYDSLDHRAQERRLRQWGRSLARALRAVACQGAEAGSAVHADPGEGGDPGER